MHAEIPTDAKATEYLANERTFLAWIRTCIAVISLGFVVARFGVWLRELSSKLDPHSGPRQTGFSLAVGVVMMALGCVLTVLSAWRYRAINRAISRGEYNVDTGIVIFVSVSVILLGVAMIAYLVATGNQL
jgi:putative membrane protein